MYCYNDILEYTTNIEYRTELSICNIFLAHVSVGKAVDYSVYREIITHCRFVVELENPRANPT